MQASGKRWITYPSRSSELTIWNLSDLHLMNRASATERIKRDINTIKNDPLAYWLGGGDYVDFIGFKDKRFDPDSVDPTVSVKDMGQLFKVGIERIKELFHPIRHKCLGLLIGNHEKCYSVKTEQDDRHGWLCTELGVPNLEYCALFDIVFFRVNTDKGSHLYYTSPKKVQKAFSVRVFAHHGAGYAQTPGGKLNRLVQFMQSFEADLYFCGHVHDNVGRREPTIGADKDCKTLVAKERLGVISGSYLKTYAQNVTTYGEQRGYRPTTLGAASIKIVPDKKTFKGEI